MSRVLSLMAAAFVAAACIPVLAAAPESTDAVGAQKADGACLQNNRLWSWNVVNSRTLAITDRTRTTFTLRIAGGCVGLTNLIPDIEIRSSGGSLSCVRRGDFVRFVEPSLGRMSCAITEVERVSERRQAAGEPVN